MSMDNGDKTVVAVFGSLTVGGFMLSSVSTQDAQLSGEGNFNPATIRPLIAAGWVATGASAVIGGVWARNKALQLIGAAMALGGLYWVYGVDHPVFAKDKATHINGVPTNQSEPATSQGLSPYQNIPDRPAVAQGVRLDPNGPATF